MLIEGGKAVATPAIAQSLGPLKINIGNVLSEVNKKTDSFKGMKVPVKLKVNTETKDFKIEIGTPPVSELIKKELGLEKGSGTPNTEKIANIAIEQLIKLVKMKKEGMYINSIKAGIKSIAGSCNSLGVLVEGKTSHEFNKDLDAGKYDDIIKQEKTEILPDKAKLLKQQLVEVQEKIKKELEKLKALEEAEKAKAAAEKPVAPEAAPAPGKEAAKVEPGKEVKAETKPKEKVLTGKEAKPVAKEEKKK